MMEKSEKELFRDKNLKKASEPERLDVYLKVTGCAPWLVTVAASLMLAVIIVWFFFGGFTTVISGAGFSENGLISCYFALSDMDNISTGSVVDVEDEEGRVVMISSKTYQSSDVPEEVLDLLPRSDRYGMAQIKCELNDGLHVVRFRLRKPFSISVGGK